MLNNRHLFLLIFLGVLAAWAADAPAASITRDQIIVEADKVADAQLKAIGDKVFIDWTWGVMDAGYAEFSHLSPSGNVYQHKLISMTDQVKWTPKFNVKAPFMADDFCIGQTFLDLYATHPDPAKLAPLKARLDALVDHLNTTQKDPKLTFSWCDSLFMAPPVLARMSAITKDPKYIDAMDKEYWRTTVALYDTNEHLFYRDARFLNKLDDNGKKIFWSRGNGWVLAGLARVLPYMPANYPQRSKYETLFKEMSAKLITLQSTDGTWQTSLEDPEEFKGPETSGTALFTYAMAWGINNHLLNRATYLPPVVRAWSAMLDARRPDGLPGHAQSVGYQPAAVKPDGTQVYTTGGYLLAATELQKLAPLDLPQAADTVDAPNHAAKK